MNTYSLHLESWHYMESCTTNTAPLVSQQGLLMPCWLPVCGYMASQGYEH